jgi:hypothetical protein
VTRYYDPNLLGDYVDPNLFGDHLGSWVSHALKHASQQVTNVASKVVGSQVANEVQRAAERTLTTGSPTTGVPIVLNPVGLAYGAVKGDPTALTALELGGAAVGLPPGILTTGVGVVGTALAAAGVPGFPSAGSGGPDLSAFDVPASGTISQAAPPRFGRKAKIAAVVVLGGLLWWHLKKRRR